MIGILIGIVICLIIAIPGFWLIGIGQVAVGCLVILAPTIAVGIGEANGRIRRRRRKPQAATPSVRDAIRAELDQAPAWWDREYDRLVKKQIPRDAATHEGHSIVEAHTYSGATLYRTCVDCNVGIDPYEEPMTNILSPDCRDGKCAACMGDAWDNATGQPCACECACHNTKEGE